MRPGFINRLIYGFGYLVLMTVVVAVVSFVAQHHAFAQYPSAWWLFFIPGEFLICMFWIAWEKEIFGLIHWFMTREKD